MAKRWTKYEINFLVSNYQNLTNREIAEKLDRSYPSIDKKAKRLKLKKGEGFTPKGFWGDKETQFLILNYSNMSNENISQELKRLFNIKKSPKSILNKANSLGLNKSKSHISYVSKFRVNKRKKKIKDGKHKCEICNNRFDKLNSLQIHISKKHPKIDLHQYYINYIGDQVKCKYCNNGSKFLSLYKGFSDKCDSNKCLSKSRAYSTKEWHKLNGSSFKDYSDKRVESFKDTITSKLEQNPYFNKEKSHNCAEYWLKRGHTLCESIKKSSEVVFNMQQVSHNNRKSNPEKYAHTYNTKLDYYLDQGMCEQEAEKALSYRQSTFSREICIEKYGEKEGLEIWEQRQDKWMRTMNSKSDEEKIEIKKKKLFNKSGYSKSSQELFKSILEKLDNNLLEKTYFSEHNGEIIKYNKQIDSCYRFDFVNTRLNKVIEFNGDFWHCNPKKYNEDFTHNILNKKASEIWEYDKIKSNFIKSLGFELLIVWEGDYIKDKKGTTQRCLEFLKNE